MSNILLAIIALLLVSIWQQLKEINERGTTVVVVTHNLDIVKAMKKRVITMRKGVVISDEDLGGTNEI